jgi:putative membrane protein insertion efficiency factor
VKRLLWWSGAPARLLLFALLGLYRTTISPILGARCRFYPSCAAYAAEAIRIHGAVKGSALSMWRIVRCSPLTVGGTDPVPQRKDGRSPSGTLSVYDTVIRSE